MQNEIAVCIMCIYICTTLYTCISVCVCVSMQGGREAGREKGRAGREAGREDRGGCAKWECGVAHRRSLARQTDEQDFRADF